MRAFTFRLTVFTLCLLFAQSAAAQQELDAVVDDRWHNGVTEPWHFESHRYTAEQAAAARALWERIGETSDGWAGDYVISMDVRAHFARWSPKGFAFFNVNTCMGNVDSLDYAETVSESPAEVSVNSQRGPRTFVKVLWGERRYLVEQHAVGAFCDYVAGLGDYNNPNGAQSGWTEFLVRSGDYAKPTALLPTVPPEYRQYVRRPIDARVTRVGRSYVEVNPENEWYDDLVTPVRIDAGSDRGLRRGMMLGTLDSDSYDERVEVTRVGPDYALGIFVRTVRKRPGVPIMEGDDGKDEPRKPIAVGWRLTTSLHKLSLNREEHWAAEAAEQQRD